jgi:nicotinamidase-related amidase
LVLRESEVEKGTVKRVDCVLLVVDVQDRLIDTIADHAAVVQNIRALVKTAETLGVPVLATEQEKLGDTVPEIRALLTSNPLRKATFSCWSDPAFLSKLDATRRKAVIMSGIETHICVVQTTLDLLKHGYRVFVVRDAASSHTVIDRDTALERAKDAGATITTTEAIIYELTERAGTEEFRKILEIVKERRKAVGPD